VKESFFGRDEATRPFSGGDYGELPLSMISLSYARSTCEYNFIENPILYMVCKHCFVMCTLYSVLSLSRSLAGFL